MASWLSSNESRVWRSIAKTRTTMEARLRFGACYNRISWEAGLFVAAQLRSHIVTVSVYFVKQTTVF
jgi:hypothetical protein